MAANRPQPRLDFGSARNWNTIEANARKFVSEWKDAEGYERGESQSFWSDFLTVFGIDRKRAGAFFEYRTRKLSGAPGFVDLFWPGRLVAEQKSAGRDLNKAIEQALDYLPAMPDHELPRAIVASDFRTFDLVRLDRVGSGLQNVASGLIPGDGRVTFTLEQLPDRVKLFDFLFDLDESLLSEQNPVNVKAAQDIAKIHEHLEKRGYTGKDLEIFLTRIVFCLFAEDTGIFAPMQFYRYVRDESNADGRNLGGALRDLFEVLNTSPDQRMQSDLNEFPYVNGGLFADPIRTPQLDADVRHAILTASTGNDWKDVNPSIFGSMFQGVMNETERRNLGAHYTSEKNILRLIQPLFLDDHYAEFDIAKNSRNRLERFHDKIANLKFLDPACGSGNFLVITYRELRRLEHKVLKELLGDQTFGLDMAHLIRVTPDQMAGIELEEFPAKVAQLALWLTDHQMNIEAAKTFGGSVDLYMRIPIKSHPRIVHANALTTDWGDVVELSDLDYIIGNPPFVGKHYRTREMSDELASLFNGIKGAGNLDYVVGWYIKAARCMEQNSAIRAAFVSTNSISQGEQVAALWSALRSYGIQISFAHQTFQWRNEAPGVAAVHCVIIGFQIGKPTKRRLFTYDSIKSEPTEQLVANVSPYLVEAPSVVVEKSTRPLSPGVPLLGNGGKPVEGGHLLLTTAERDALLGQEPMAGEYVRPFTMGDEFINGQERWCLWLENADPGKIRQMPEVLKRVDLVREYRLKSTKAATRDLAKYPMRFAEIRTSSLPYLAIPKVSSERREYIPMGYLHPQVVPGDKVFFLPESSLYAFGILTSNMHMAWMRTVAGRLKSDYSYSIQIVYNNFPWPEDVTDAQHQKIEQLAQAVLDARANHPGSTLADLYDPLAMPADLRKAHTELDRAVDKLYRSKKFESDDERVAMLLARYQKLVGE